MLSKPSALRALAKRPSAWAFEKLDTQLVVKRFKQASADRCEKVVMTTELRLSP
jgi:hypothetical protein